MSEIMTNFLKELESVCKDKISCSKFQKIIPRNDALQDLETNFPGLCESPWNDIVMTLNPKIINGVYVSPEDYVVVKKTHDIFKYLLTTNRISQGYYDGVRHGKDGNYVSFDYKEIMKFMKEFILNRGGIADDNWCLFPIWGPIPDWQLSLPLRHEPGF